MKTENIRRCIGAYVNGSSEIWDRRCSVAGTARAELSAMESALEQITLTAKYLDDGAAKLLSDNKDQAARIAALEEVLWGILSDSCEYRLPSGTCDHQGNHPELSDAACNRPDCPILSPAPRLMRHK